MLLEPHRLGPRDHMAAIDLTVDPSCWGVGVGRQLATHVVADATMIGYHALEVHDVVETNTHALDLSGPLSFTKLASVPETFRHPDHGQVGVYLMHLHLT